MSPWHKLLEHPHAGGHFVQLYAADETALVKNAGRYLWEGLRRGEGVLVIAAAEHQRSFSHHLSTLGADVQQSVADGQLVFLDAHATLASFMRSGQPDWIEFEKVIRGAIRRMHRREGVDSSRAYGEMVGILWKARRFATAVRLEQFWNKLLEQSAFSLYCAYAIDIFGQEFAGSNLDSVLCTHTHLIPAEPDGHLEAALNRSMDEILGAEADQLRMRMKAKSNPAWAIMPAAESMILCLQEFLPEQAQNIRERAREYYLTHQQRAVVGETG
ncbi:MAG TPA: MEDS domain-containing protein [Bryobacteraceae bacterium]|nr:MEDS domain-containing protein [Bryobacteraceae bacterium]